MPAINFFIFIPCLLPRLMGGGRSVRYLAFLSAYSCDTGRYSESATLPRPGVIAGVFCFIPRGLERVTNSHMAMPCDYGPEIQEA